jgi:transcription elongation factor Elf1
MATLYKSLKCPRCGEDDLIITLNKGADRLYLNCGECEASWNHPDEVVDTHKMFIDLTIDATEPSFEDIKKFAWNQYVTGTILV